MESTDSQLFYVEVHGGVGTSFQWIVEPLALRGAPVGNYPAAPGVWNVPSQGGTARTLVISSLSWFATPDSNLSSATGLVCLYEINCEAVVNGQTVRDPFPPALPVFVPNLQGTTNWPWFEEERTIQIATRTVAGGGTEWYVVGQGRFARHNARATVHLRQASQFYAKALVHENEHVRQLNVDPRWAHIMDANDLYNTTLRHLTSGVNEADLRRKIENEVTGQEAADNLLLALTRQQREVEAYAADRTVPPHYLEKTDAEVRAQYP
ncbi:MAG TPA: hypothetical protein VFS35_07890 [Terrimicrobiaceae bacterium]|nr:hypothetical protein [Terrimicrobiaceae bacterium]